MYPVIICDWPFKVKGKRRALFIIIIITYNNNNLSRAFRLTRRVGEGEATRAV